MESMQLNRHMSKSAAKEALDNYEPIYPDEKIFIQEMKRFLNEHEVFAHRSNLDGHFTGSAWVVNSDYTHALLIHHVKLNRWFQPGGHTEYGDESFRATSLREAEEEIGITGFKPEGTNIFDIDVHSIPKKNEEPEHKHYDVRYLWVLNDMDISKIDTIEVHGAKWVSIEELLQDTTISSSIRRMAEKTKRRSIEENVKSVNKLF